MSDFGVSPAVVWIVVGLVLCALEILAPGAFLIWIGLAALTTGLLSLALGFSLPVALVLCALLAVGYTLVGRKIYGGREPHDGAVLNDKARALIGRQATLDRAIDAEAGRLRIDDAQWRVRGPELPAGARVRVVAVAEDGVTLVVEAQ